MVIVSKSNLIKITNLCNDNFQNNSNNLNMFDNNNVICLINEFL